jgi:multiple sugar transport system permease protein/raffinose/stachyose/melibiose transport system permease protein
VGAVPCRTVVSAARPFGITLRRRGHRFWLIFLQAAVAALVLFPFFWMLSVSLKPANEPFAIPTRLWPASPTLANYVTAFRPEFRTYFVNSVIVSGATVMIAITLGLLAAYCLTRFQTRLLALVMALLIGAQMFPSSAIIIPIYRIMKAAHLLNTLASLVIADISITLPVAIWILRGFLSRLPIALEEAAAIDGAGPLRTFFFVILPLCRPGIVATAVFVLIVTWQEFLFALSFTSTRDVRTLPVGMNDFIGQYGIRYGDLMASSVLVSVPVILVFFVLQRQLIAGLTGGAMKGMTRW